MFLLKTTIGQDELACDEAKAENLLYYIIKDHPFVDGNKRIGALALMTAKSLPQQKETVVALIVNMLVDT
ncbi:MAG: hypothetical protein DRQ78_03160 [Epsilonproteobacteria bacterium]|nr:MAG: hypothetical protein DRQ78_03160 [Campylobacterota bacterium]